MSELHDGLIALVRRGQAPFLREYEPGCLRVGDTRVGLSTVAHALQDGSAPEQVVDAYPTLATEDVPGVAELLQLHPAEVAEYRDRREADALRREIEARQGDAGEFWARLRARRDAARTEQSEGGE